MIRYPKPPTKTLISLARVSKELSKNNNFLRKYPLKHIMKKRLLIIDDEQNMRHMLSVMLQRAGYDVASAADGEQGWNALVSENFDLVLCDVKMPNMDGIALLEKLAKHNRATVVIMMSAYGTIDLAVEAMRHGAFDFITKPFKRGEILLSLERANERAALQQENSRLRQQVANLQGKKGFEAMIATNPEMLNLIATAEKIAQYNATVLINGESGTGKELFAQGIHKASPRKDRPFIAINCGSIPADLLESEFFGHVKGAFTGADTTKKGLFEEAHRGTLFLDEVGELPLALQVKFLRVLQEEEIRPVGGATTRKIDVRIIAATAKDLATEVQQGRFRNDLYYRLNVVNFTLPPLRKRRDDIYTLVPFFIDKISRQTGLKVRDITTEALQLLAQNDWPGNVRELENAIERAVILSEGTTITAREIQQAPPTSQQNDNLINLLGTSSLKTAQKILEEKFIAAALRQANGNKTQAARILEISYPSLLAKIKIYKYDGLF